METNTKKIKKIKTTREKFYSAVMNCAVVCKQYPKTKLEYWCNRFLEINKAEIKDHEKREKKLRRPIANEFRDFFINHALEKDGILVINKDTDEYEPKSKADKIKIEDKRIECDDKIEQLLEPFLEEEVEIRVIEGSINLPDDFSIRMDNYLNGFVYTNKNEFEEDEEEVSSE